MISVDFYSLALTIPALTFLAHFVPWLVDPRGIKGHPGPFSRIYGWASQQDGTPF